ncbi:MAG: hypothetical protein V4687_18105 [Bacteroidota bacterium]
MSGFNAVRFLIIFQLAFGCFTAAFAQNDKGKLAVDTSINMHGQQGLEGGEFNITISKVRGIFKIVYVVNDSLNDLNLNKDRTFKRLTRIMNNGSLFRKGLSQKQSIKYIRVFRKHQVNSADSITFTERYSPAFTEAFLNIFADNFKEFDRRRGIALDGYDVYFKTIAAGKVREKDVHSPSKALDPMLCNLMSQTVAVYKDFPNRNLLAKTVLKYY